MNEETRKKSIQSAKYILSVNRDTCYVLGIIALVYLISWLVFG